MNASLLYNIPNQLSTSEEWQQWHTSLKSVGANNANSLFLQAWKLRGNNEVANDADLRQYLEKNGLRLEGTEGIFSEMADFSADFSEFFNNLVGAGKWISIIIIAIIIIGLAMLVFNIAKNPGEIAKMIKVAA